MIPSGDTFFRRICGAKIRQDGQSENAMILIYGHNGRVTGGIDLNTRV